MLSVKPAAAVAAIFLQGRQINPEVRSSVSEGATSDGFSPTSGQFVDLPQFLR